MKRAMLTNNHISTNSPRHAMNTLLLLTTSMNMLNNLNSNLLHSPRSLTANIMMTLHLTRSLLIPTTHSSTALSSYRNHLSLHMKRRTHSTTYIFNAGIIKATRITLPLNQLLHRSITLRNISNLRLTKNHLPRPLHNNPINLSLSLKRKYFPFPFVKLIQIITSTALSILLMPTYMNHNRQPQQIPHSLQPKRTSRPVPTNPAPSKPHRYTKARRTPQCRLLDTSSTPTSSPSTTPQDTTSIQS